MSKKTTSRSLLVGVLALLCFGLLENGVTVASPISGSVSVRQESAAEPTDSGNPASAEEQNKEKPQPEKKNGEKPEKAKEKKISPLVQKVNEAIKPVDEFFGDYLVKPLASVFFFDFYSGPQFEEGREYTDTDGDGKYDEGEPVVANKVVKITAKDGKEYAVTTDDEGKWKAMTSPGWLGVSLPFVVVWLFGISFKILLKIACKMLLKIDF